MISAQAGLHKNCDTQNLIHLSIYFITLSSKFIIGFGDVEFFTYNIHN